MSLSGKTALITGGARGLGKAFAARILEAGGNVSLADLNAKIGQETAAEFNKKYEGRACFVACDVTNKTQLENAFDVTERTFGKVNVLCNNAGIAPVWFDQSEATVAINLMAVITGTQLGYDRMTEGGVIVNIASMAGIVPVPLVPVYAATKAGVVNFSRSCGPLFYKKNIRVNALCPAFTRTNMVTDMWDNPRFRKLVESTGGVMEPELIADAFMDVVTNEARVGSVLMITPNDGIQEHRNRSKL